MHEPVVFGLNYATASFAVREKLAFTRDEIPHVLERLQNAGVTTEALILSTCNRTEIYCLTQDIDFVINAICDIKGACPRTVKQYSYVYVGTACAKHLFAVASGLESMVLGETEIVAQIKSALQLARECGSVKSVLAALLEMALAAAKEVRNTTNINGTAISIGSAVTSLVCKHFPDLSSEQILFIGAGQMMRQVAPHFGELSLAKKMVINRSLHHAEMLASRINAEYTSLENLPHLINSYSVIIASSGSDHLLINSNILSPNLLAEQEDTTAISKTLIIDLSVPLITDMALAKYPNITILTIDDIAKVVDVGVSKRKLAATAAHQVIEKQLVLYQEWCTKRELTPAICALREHAAMVRLEALSDARKQLDRGGSIEEVIDDLANQLINKLLHSMYSKLQEEHYASKHS